MIIYKFVMILSNWRVLKCFVEINMETQKWFYLVKDKDAEIQSFGSQV